MTPAEKRDATLRTVQLPDCCGNCVYRHPRWRTCQHMESGILNVAYDNHCDLHERKTEGGSDG